MDCYNSSFGCLYILAVRNNEKNTKPCINRSPCSGHDSEPAEDGLTEQ